MKISFGKSNPGKNERTVLFVCVENAGTSQMAEGFFNKCAPDGYMGISAGIKPVSEINPVAIEVMKEIGIDISNQKSKEISDDMIRNSFKTVNMGCMDREACPTLFLANVLNWHLEDPKNKPIETVREIRDEIGRRIRKLVTGLESNQSINI